MASKKVSISSGNAKVGEIKSVSLPPILTCAYGCPCAKDCYAVKLQRIYPSVRKAYLNNYEILQADRDFYFKSVKASAMLERYFRWHVSGDVVDYDYFVRMVDVANSIKDCKFLAFTKRYDIINDYIRNGNEIPNNLKIIFSAWKGYAMENPFNMPTSEVIFKDTEINDNWKICGGNCSECACRGVGCWELNKGETIAFYKH